MSTSSKGWIGALLVALAIGGSITLGFGISAEADDVSDSTDAQTQCIGDLISTADTVIKGSSEALNLASLGLQNSRNTAMLQSLNNEMQQNLPQFKLDVQEYQATKARCGNAD